MTVDQIAIPYHQPAFLYLQDAFGKELREALLDFPVRLRVDFWKESLPTNIRINPDFAWRVCRKLLIRFEDEISEVLSTRSVFFWLHLYRRIGVDLHPEHEGKTDARTLGLVRNLVELAILKYGRLDTRDDVKLSNKVRAEEILGGFFQRGMESLFRENFTTVSEMFTKSFHENPEWVIVEFEKQDFIGIYRVEGLAYQYWRITALMRALGKGSGIVLHADGEWTHYGDKNLSRLIESIDKRTDRSPFESSLIGVWFGEDDATPSSSEEIESGRAIGTIYNIERVEIPQVFAAMGLDIAPGFIPNFLPISLDLKKFLATHHFMEEAFKNRYGVSLETFIGTVWALANFTASLAPMSVNGNEDSKPLVVSLINLIQRGYKTIPFSFEKIADSLVPYTQTFLPDSNIKSEDIARVLPILTLSPDKQTDVSLWSGGPRSMLIPYNDEATIIDLQGVPWLLFSLFVSLAHDSTLRGSVFEEAFRSALETRGYDVFSGELRLNSSSKRELDAGVRVGNRLVLFECVSIERPLDYEIGKPETFANRRERLDEKISQVLSLEDFLKDNPNGRNYDFSWAEEINSFVVSPFVEWAWEKSMRLWLDDDTPRIVSASEAISFLEREAPS